MPKPIKHIEQIAEYIYAYPDKKNVEIVAFFVRKWHKSDRTIQRYLSKAQNIVAERLKIEKEAKNKTIAREAEKSIKKEILTRQRAIEILTDIAEGRGRKINGQIFVPADRERVSAIKEISEFEGWKSPNKIENTIQIETPLTKERRKEIENSLNEDF